MSCWRKSGGLKENAMRHNGKEDRYGGGHLILIGVGVAAL
jgi:hypothetical protein